MSAFLLPRTQTGLLVGFLLWLWPPCWEADKWFFLLVRPLDEFGWGHALPKSLLGRASLHSPDLLVLQASLFNRLCPLCFLWSSRKWKGKKQNRVILHLLPKNIQDFVTTKSRKQATNLYLHSWRKHPFKKKGAPSQLTTDKSELRPSSEILSSFSFPSALSGLTRKSPGLFPIYVLQCLCSLPSNHLLGRGFMIQIW